MDSRHDFSDARLPWLDIAKAIGVVIVLINHIQLQIGKGSYYLGAFYMALFFVIAGYTFHEKKGESFFTFFIKKGKRLLLPYFIYNLFFVLFFALRGQISKDAALGIFYSRNQLYPESLQNRYFLTLLNAPMWFLTALFVTLCLYWVIKKIANGNKKGEALLVTILFFCGSLVKNLCPVLLPWSIDTALVSVFLLFAGEILRDWEILEKLYLNFWCNLVLAVVFFLIVRFNGPGNMSIRDFGTSTVLFVAAGILGSVLCLEVSMLLARYGGKAAYLLQQAGTRTITLLCLHMFCFALFQTACAAFSVPWNQWSKAVIIILTILILVIGEVLCRKIKLFK